MKASELISELKKAVNEHGDMEVLVRDVEGDCNWSGLTVWPDPPSPTEIEEGVEGTIDINVF